MSKQSKDQEKLGKFYTFEVTAEKLQTVQQKARKMYFKHFRNAFIFGFCIELMITKSRIYENIVRKSTQRRLESKKKEDDNLKLTNNYIENK
ncbi:unnamed protein product [Paramecium sonneborni]|uniref:Uncharacterized protein n=1 Tax=Paramecium sonneborni TaxID=65129 RepID=A0A8S1QLK6_9CILI|nr:unnamed protein product [Paramecium sonneborni]